MAMARILGENGCYIVGGNEKERKDGKALAIYGLRLSYFGETYFQPVYYYGEWKDGMRNGIGYWFFARDDVAYRDGKGGPLEETAKGFFELEWVDDVPNGSMKYFGDDGYVAEGEVVDGLFNGEIRAILPHHYVWESYYDSLDADGDGFEDESGLFMAIPEMYMEAVDAGPVEVVYRFDHGKVQPIREKTTGYGYVVAEAETGGDPVEMIFYEEAVKDLKHGILGYGESFFTLFY